MGFEMLGRVQSSALQLQLAGLPKGSKYPIIKYLGVGY